MARNKYSDSCLQSIAKVNRTVREDRAQMDWNRGPIFGREFSKTNLRYFGDGASK